MGKIKIFKIGLILTLQFTISVHSQGYANIEDDTPAPTGNNAQPQQQISSLPQYDPDPAGYGQAPAPAPGSSNLQSNPSPSVDQSQAQEFWWNNQPAFQKPAGHPGVEPSDNSAAAPQSNNRAPNAYNPPAPQQNNFQQSRPQPQKPQQYKPQPQPQQSRTPYTPSGSGWNGPGSNPGSNSPPASSSNFNQPPPSNSLAQPGNNFGSSQPFVVPTPECQLLNKADCHRRAPQGQTPQEPDQGQGYNVPQSAQPPPQNYRPPPPNQAQTPQRNPAPQPQQPVAQPPPGFYQPPPPQPYDSQPQNVPSNQNYQPQFSQSQPPQSSSFPQSGQRPQQPYRSPAQQQGQPQQQYNRPAPQGQPQGQGQPQQQYSNNGQYNAPQSAQPNQYYQSQPQQQQPVGEPVIGPIDDQAPFPGCPAAMLCVQDDQCNLIGVIEDNLRLSYADKAHRVALSKCSEPSTGIQGICCRDPNYKDPWPDMNGGGNSGQYQPHHHDKGNHHDKGHQHQGAEPQGSFRNPYAEFGDRKKKSPSVNPSRGSPTSAASTLYNDNKGNEHNNKPSTSTITSHEEPQSEFDLCQPDESCVIHYKCGSKNGNAQTKKCKEDIFRNAYHCCKLSQSTTFQPTRKTFAPTTTPTPTTYEPSIFTIATIRPLPERITHKNVHPTLPQPPPTFDSIYKNNPFLTDTFPPEEFAETTPPTTISSTPSNLITGLGQRFHSHLHSPSALEVNKVKPNPYIDPETGFTQPAIVPEVEVEITEKTTFPTKSSNNHSTGNVAQETNSILIEPLSASSNNRVINSSFMNNNEEMSSSTPVPLNSTTQLPENYTEVYEPPANRTREILQNFWNVDNYLNISTEVESGSSGESKLEKVTHSRKFLPTPVPLRDELVEYPPPGFIFKEYDLYIPESIVPAGYFQPPKFQYGERQYPIPADFIEAENTTTLPPDDDVTTILPEMANDDKISSQEIKTLL